MVSKQVQARRFRLLGMLALMLTLLLAGCSGGNSSNQSAASPSSSGSPAAQPSSAAPSPTDSAKPKEIVELKGYFPGDTPKDFEEVLAAVNDKLAKDNVGVKLNIQFIGWSDYTNSTSLKLTAGENFDMLLEAPFVHMNQMIASKAILPLDDYIQNAPNLLKTIPESMWDNNKFADHIYGIPNGNTQGLVQGVLIRGDLREQYGMEPLKTIDDLKKFLYTVKEKNPEMIPFGIDGRNGNFASAKFNPAIGDGAYHGGPTSVKLINVNAEGKVIPFWEADGQTEAWQTITQLYKDGIIEKNVMMQQNATQLFNMGKVAAVHWQSDGVAGLQHTDALKLPGVKLEIFVHGDGAGAASDFRQGNFTSIPATSKHPELVIAFLDWLSIKENHDLLQYGIEGKHWIAVGDDSYKVVEGSQYAFPGYVVSWRPSLERVPEHMIPDDKKWFKFSQDANNFIKSELANFTADTTAVKSEVAKMAPLNDEFSKPMSAGVLPYDEGIKQLKEAAKNAGVDKVLEEVQKQFDAFRVSQK